MSVELIGFRELKLAVERNPQKVLSESKLFLSRGLAAYKRGIIRNPWKIQSIGGGVPVGTGHLRDTHVTRITGLTGSIGPNETVAPYAKFVHHGTRRMRRRPWLDYTKKSKSNEIQKLYRSLLKEITKDLAK